MLCKETNWHDECCVKMLMMQSSVQRTLGLPMLSKHVFVSRVCMRKACTVIARAVPACACHCVVCNGELVLPLPLLYLCCLYTGSECIRRRYHCLPGGIRRSGVN
ncbi:hypothetical protein XELAEV_18015119mg [Xenopus laevis]|uniref:Uncharacterized protein n=1 Tax=Xenopus laevis TaxID=8355 RepID=A0A974DHX5_XENLA|nr:hypothetical protein XELAEV_18015119mg [Xenopus laevis]